MSRWLASRVQFGSLYTVGSGGFDVGKTAGLPSAIIKITQLVLFFRQFFLGRQRMSMFIGEALAGDGNEIAHIDLLIGSKDGPVG